ncbi:unnamed protein product, partial [Iphiclides podalirius]
MGAIKGYFKSQLQWQMIMLEYEDVSEFYLSAFQKNRSVVPLLFLRVVICLGCVGIVVSSAVLSVENMAWTYWPIFLTHWGLILNMIAAAFAVVVSARAYLRGPIDALFGLPWYVKMHWVMTNISTVIAIFITVFYWTLLSNTEEDYAVILYTGHFHSRGEHNPHAGAASVGEAAIPAAPHLPADHCRNHLRYLHCHFLLRRRHPPVDCRPIHISSS